MNGPLTRKQNNSKTVDDLTIALVPILETELEEKLTWTFWREKKQYIKKWLKIPTRRRKIWCLNKK